MRAISQRTGRSSFRSSVVASCTIAALAGCAEGGGITAPTAARLPQVAATSGAVGRTITSISLTPPSPLLPGLIAMVSVRVQLTSGAVWKGTKWDVRNSANAVVASSVPSCVNTMDHAEGDFDSFSGGHTEMFPLMAPANGAYTLNVSAYSTDACIDPADATTGTLAFVVGTVSPVNQPPVLTVPGDVTTPWGTPLAALHATAADPDTPNLAFSMVSGPAWVSVATDGTISFGATTAVDIGSHTVRVRVTELGTTSLSDEEEFHVVVQPRPARVTYTGRTTGQYSDRSRLSAVLVDDGAGPLNGTPIGGQSLTFAFGGAPAGSAGTGTTGSASLDFLVGGGAGSSTVVAAFAGAAGYAAATSAPQAFSVGREDAGLSTTAPASLAGNTASFTIDVTAQELLVGGVEPAPNDGALPGDVGGITAVVGTLTGMSSGQVYSATCTAGSTGGTGYGAARTFGCNFSGGPFAADAYTLSVALPTSEGHYGAAPVESVVLVWDPTAGFPSGGGTFRLGGDLVSFGFSYSVVKGGTTIRGGFVAVRHFADGSTCRLKSTNQMSAPAVSGNQAMLLGRGTYSCLSATGVSTASQGNAAITVYVEDNGTSGAGQDRIWLSNAAAATPNALLMTGSPTDVAVTLTGGNIHIPATAGGAGRLKIYQ